MASLHLHQAANESLHVPVISANPNPMKMTDVS